MPETSAVRWHNRLVSLGPDTFGDFLPCHAPQFCSGHGRTRRVEVLPGLAPQGLPRTENKSRAALAETFCSSLNLHCDRPHRGVRGSVCGILSQLFPTCFRVTRFAENKPGGEGKEEDGAQHGNSSPVPVCQPPHHPDLLSVC